MIKLIATDMDGTLLDDNKQLPKILTTSKRLLIKISVCYFKWQKLLHAKKTVF